MTSLIFTFYGVEPKFFLIMKAEPIKFFGFTLLNRSQNWKICYLGAGAKKFSPRSRSRKYWPTTQHMLSFCY